MKTLRFIFTLASLALLWVPRTYGRTIDQIPNVHLQNRTRYVSDPDNYMSPASIARADSIIASIWNSTSAEPVAVIVKDMGGVDIDTYATSLFEAWGLGKKDKDNGVLLLVSVDDRKGVIRTGYGAEGVLPDILCGRILRNEMFPRFREGDYEGGVTAALQSMSVILTDPEAAEELRSKYENDSGAEKGDEGEAFFRFYLMAGCAALVILLVILIYTYLSDRKRPRLDRYMALRSKSPVYLALTVMFFGIPLLAYILLKVMMWRVRHATPRCPNCQQRMRLIDEVHDNDYLTPAQDKEEQLNSVDYDVWHCDNCGENEIIPYVNSSKHYHVCPACGSRAEIDESNVILQNPTSTREGIGRKTFHCKNCNNRREQIYKIAKVAAAPIIVAEGPRGGRGGGFGGFGGGSFGGGMTGGGGASGGW